jgi:hypothetical protein
MPSTTANQFAALMLMQDDDGDHHNDRDSNDRDSNNIDTWRSQPIRTALIPNETRFRIFNDSGALQVRRTFLPGAKVVWQLSWQIPHADRLLSQRQACALLDMAHASGRIRDADMAVISLRVMSNALVLQTTRLLDDNGRFVVTQAKADAISELVRAALPAATFANVVGRRKAGLKPYAYEPADQVKADEEAADDEEWTLEAFMELPGVLYIEDYEGSEAGSLSRASSVSSGRW